MIKPQRLVGLSPSRSLTLLGALVMIHPDSGQVRVYGYRIYLPLILRGS